MHHTMTKDASHYGQQRMAPHSRMEPYYCHEATETPNTHFWSQSFTWKFPYCNIARSSTPSDTQEKKYTPQNTNELSFQAPDLRKHSCQHKASKVGLRAQTWTSDRFWLWQLLGFRFCPKQCVRL